MKHWRRIVPFAAVFLFDILAVPRLTDNAAVAFFIGVLTGIVGYLVGYIWDGGEKW